MHLRVLMHARVCVRSRALRLYVCMYCWVSVCLYAHVHSLAFVFMMHVKLRHMLKSPQAKEKSAIYGSAKIRVGGADIEDEAGDEDDEDDDVVEVDDGTPEGAVLHQNADEAKNDKPRPSGSKKGGRHFLPVSEPDIQWVS